MKLETKIVLSLADGFHSSQDISKIENGFVVDEESTILWGPYIELPAGSWTVAFFGEYRPGPKGVSSFDVSADAGFMIVGRGQLKRGAGLLGRLTVSTKLSLPNIEFRVHAAAGSKIRITHIELERSDIAAHHSLIQNMPSAGSYFDLYKREGLRLVLDRDSYVDRYIIEHGTWEANQIFFLKQLLMKCPNDGSRLAFLDIGAYFGLYSVHMARTAAFDEIHAFEADTLNFRQLQANLLLNDPDMKVQAHNFAVASKDDEVQFLPSWKHPTGNRGGVGMLRDDHSEIHQSVRIKSKALDSILHLKGYTIIAKIDVEGWDFDVLLGMEKLLNENRCAIQIECLPDNDASDENKQRIDNFLNERGYRSFHSIGVDLYYSNFL